AADGYEPTAGLSFSWDSNRFISRLPQGWNVQRAYLDLMSVADAKDVLRDGMNQGVALTSFVGHSGLDRWTFDGLFFSSDAQALTNAGRPTVVTQWGCWNTYHVDPRYNTLGHRFLLSGEQGAAAVLGAATLTDARHEELLGYFVMNRLVDPGTTMGEAIQEAKAQLAIYRPGYLDVLLGWTLLGDPAVVIEP
ncbi:MAG: C25 family cysteine peptidase, partial [Anaerolineae bacterium]